MVNDSPNQQAQDDLNLPAVLSFIAKDLPAGMQLIVGLETPTDLSFDSQEVLTQKYQMLTERDWEPTFALVEPLLKRMYEVTMAQSRG